MRMKIILNCIRYADQSIKEEGKTTDNATAAIPVDGDISIVCSKNSDRTNRFFYKTYQV